MAWGILAGVKERLTGAVILVALMVLLVPELLTGPIRTRSAPAASVTAASSPAPAAVPPPHGQPPLRTYTLTLGPPPPAHEALAPQPAEAEPAESARESPPAQAPQGSSAVKPARAAADDPAAAAAPAPHDPRRGARTGSSLQALKAPTHPAMREASATASSRGWVVQLGSFADRKNADRLARSLEARGFRMAVSPARAGSRVLWRVRTGAARDRSGAQRLAARLRALGHRGEVLPAR